MKRKWYIKFSDSKKAEEVSFYEYCILHSMARFYNAVVSDNFHPKGKTLVVNFTKHFV